MSLFSHEISNGDNTLAIFHEHMVPLQLAISRESAIKIKKRGKNLLMEMLLLINAT